MNSIARPLLLELSETAAHTREIALAVAGFEIRGQIALEGAVLHLEGGDGSVSAQRLVITSVTITGHGVRLGAQQLEASGATIGWGRAGLHVEAATLDIGALQVIADEGPAEGTVMLDTIKVTELRVHDGDVRVGRALIASAHADGTLVPRTGAATEPGAGEPSPASGTRPASLERLLAVLDRLTGHINVDLGLDLSVPVIGRRRATHHFRIPIDAGTIDYMRLENNLSTLEDALLDFSVRDEGLVLEVGIPLLPTRGRGKPIVRWPVDGADLELARRDRVRLSVLAQPSVGNGNGAENGSHDGAADASSEDRSSPVALRHAQLDKLDIQLAVAPAEHSPIRRVGSLVIAADAMYTADESGEGARVAVVARELLVEELHVTSLAGDELAREPALDGAGGEHARVPHAPRS